MARIDNLKNIKVTDVFYYKKNRGECAMIPVQCTKLTPKFAFIGGRKYRRENASEIYYGGSAWYETRELYDAQETIGG